MSEVSDTRLFVGRIPYEWDDNDIRFAFESFGRLKEATVSLDRSTGGKRGFGFVEFVNPADACAARTSMDEFIVHDHPLRVEQASAR